MGAQISEQLLAAALRLDRRNTVTDDPLKEQREASAEDIINKNKLISC